MTTQTLAQRLAAEAVRYYERRASIPTATLARAQNHVLDVLGNALGGSRADSSTKLREGLSHLQRGMFTAIGVGGLAQAEYAALLNGAAAHTLEMDDTHNASSTHPGAVAVPAALAAAEMVRASGRELLAAVIAAYQVTTRIGMALGPAEQYARGFHPTSTCGVFGAATAAGLLLDFDACTLAVAYGICGSLASGLIEFLGDGSLVKRLHPGWSAFAGITAARLARAGFTGPVTVFEGMHGLFQAFSGAARPELLAGDWDAPEILATSIKAHACCRYMQAPIDAVLAIVREHGIRPEQVERVEFGLLGVAWNVIAEPRAQKLNPRTIVDAQFSMPYGGAVALARGRASVQEFSEEALNAPDIRALLPRMHCVHDESLDPLYPQQWPATATVYLRDGRRLHARVEDPKGDPANPLTATELAEKFRTLAAPAIDDERAARIVAAVQELADAPSVLPLMELLGGVPAHLRVTAVHL